MNRIAILTLYYQNYNYGGVLQAYALQKVVKNLGYDSRQISYILDSGYGKWSFLKWSIRKKIGYFYYTIKYGKWMKKYNKRRMMINKFAKKIDHTEVVTAKNISRLLDKYDCFICGSDQIWNPIGWQPTFFFDFLPKEKKRFSYAASVARDTLSQEQLEYMRKYLVDFYAISIREKGAADLLNTYASGLKVVDMPDPVFLLKKDQWLTLINRSNERKIIAYFLGDNNENREKAINYAMKKNIKIQFVSFMNKGMYLWEKEHKEFLADEMGIEDFLTEIANAQMVLTDSFHAAAFSCIFETPFYALPRFENSDCNSMNSRLDNLVNELEIKERFRHNGDLLEDYAWTSLEYDNLRRNINRLYNKGMNFLKETLSDVEK